MSPHRFRGNLWVDGWEPFAELALVGRRLRLGEAELAVEARITRCKATHMNPETGTEDADTLGLLETHWGHRDFGVYARVTRGGRVAAGDAVEVLE